MPGVFLEEFVVRIGKLLYLLGKLLIELPELWARAVSHKSVQRPSRRSRMASSARASRRPAATSSSNCLSHAVASKLRNQSRNAVKSPRESFWTAFSMSTTVLMPKRYRYRISGQARKHLKPLPGPARFFLAQRGCRGTSHGGCLIIVHSSLRASRHFSESRACRREMSGLGCAPFSTSL